jgi:hypothetical protein
MEHIGALGLGLALASGALEHGFKKPRRRETLLIRSPEQASE